MKARNGLALLLIVCSLIAFQFGQIVIGGILMLLGIAVSDTRSYRVH